MLPPLSMTALVRDGYVVTNYPGSLRVIVRSAASAWADFCNLPVQLKKAFVYTEEGNVDGAGYELKEEKASGRDLKENFHVTRQEIERLHKIAVRQQEPAAITFVQTANDVLELLEPLILDFAKSLEDEYGIDGLHNEVCTGRNRWILRYLHYFGNRAVGEEIASPHADKSGFTFHLYESDKGLQYLAFDKQWAEMPMAPGKTVVIPNIQLQYRSRGRLTALCHRVVATAESASIGRHSMVCFIPFMKTPPFDTKGKGRQQDFLPGFNYFMSHDDLRQYFEL